MSHFARATTAIAALLLALVAPAAAAAPGLQPEALPRGADLARPYVEGVTIVDGARRVDVPLRRPVLVATARRGYIVRDRRFADAVFLDHAGTKRQAAGCRRGHHRQH